MNVFFQELREQLEKQRKVIKRRTDKIDAHLRQVDGPLSADFQEQAVELENDEVLAALGQSGHIELEQINRALAKLDNDLYGYCEVCDGEIHPNRLKAVPYTPMCIECAEAAERRQRTH